MFHSLYKSDVDSFKVPTQYYVTLFSDDTYQADYYVFPKMKFYKMLIQKAFSFKQLFLKQIPIPHFSKYNLGESKDKARVRRQV